MKQLLCKTRKGKIPLSHSNIPLPNLKDSVRRWIFCVYALFSRSFKALNYPIQLLTFYLLLWNYSLIFKMPSSKFFALWFVSKADLPVARIILSLVASGYDFTKSKAASCMHLQCQMAALGSLKRITGRIVKISK